jgi:hypothetical protein
VQLVADHQDGAARLAPDRVDQLVEGGRARLVEPGGRFVQQEEIGFRHERARQQHALELPAGELRHLPSGEVGHARARALPRSLPALAPPGRRRNRSTVIGSVGSTCSRCGT